VRKLLLAVLLTVCAPLSLASPVVYSLSDHVGTDSISGTITTDGTIGVLASGDITSFILTFSDGISDVTFTESPFSIDIEGSGVTASSTSLTIDYGITGNFFLQNVSGGPPYYCLSGGTTICGNLSGSGAFLDGGNNEMDVSRSGIQDFASIAAVGAVPEPELLSLVGLGMAAISVARRKRTRWVLGRSVKEALAAPFSFVRQSPLASLIDSRSSNSTRALTSSAHTAGGAVASQLVQPSHSPLSLKPTPSARRLLFSGDWKQKHRSLFTWLGVFDEIFSSEGSWVPALRISRWLESARFDVLLEPKVKCV
jgi:PEP-CTERM motif